MADLFEKEKEFLFDMEATYKDIGPELQAHEETDVTERVGKYEWVCGAERFSVEFEKPEIVLDVITWGCLQLSY